MHIKEDTIMINYAHRGASEYAPENTMASFYLGLELGANGIETDVRETSDGVLVLFHDESTLRLTGEDIMVAEMTYDELYSKDLGSHKSKKYANEKVVTLDDFLKYFSAKEIELAIEIKSSNIEKKVVDLIYKYNCSKKVTITSFQFEILKKIREFDQNIKLGFLTKTLRKNIMNELLLYNINQYCPMIDLVTKEMVEEAHGLGLTVRTFSIKSVELMNKAIACGVDGMTINFPEKLYEALKGG